LNGGLWPPQNNPTADVGVGKVAVTDSGRVWFWSEIRQRQLADKARNVIKYMTSHVRSEHKQP
jgi:hypothetical protein